ncbi:hypothetical protein ERO13_D08G200201v2 [Gossypium hirsutum]|nr:hypothetical protein ERO13_D08G200201v2 [Gossypium hirsutum]
MYPPKNAGLHKIKLRKSYLLKKVKNDESESKTTSTCSFFSSSCSLSNGCIVVFFFLYHSVPDYRALPLTCNNSLTPLFYFSQKL